MAKVTTVELRNGLLIVRAKDARWAREVERARDTILPRVRLFLGADGLRDLRVVTIA